MHNFGLHDIVQLVQMFNYYVETCNKDCMCVRVRMCACVCACVCSHSLLLHRFGVSLAVLFWLQLLHLLLVEYLQLL